MSNSKSCNAGLIPDTPKIKTDFTRIEKKIFMIRLLLPIFLCCFTNFLFSQNFTQRTFKDTRVINTHTVETLAKRKMDVRIGHRFGDLAGSSGGWQSFYGLENAADIMFGVEYGIMDNLTVGLSRTKGAGPLKKLINTSLKYRFLRQKKDESMPVSMTAYGLWSVSTMSKDTSNTEVLNNFPQFSHRIMYTAQILIARKFSDVFSLQVIPSYTHRNLVPFNDDNNLFSLGFAVRIQLSKVFGIIADATFPFSDLRTTENGYYPPMGIGLEIDTGGHIFQINFTNARGIAETDYIPNTKSDWSKGQFRLGFTISRTFNL